MNIENIHKFDAIARIAGVHEKCHLPFCQNVEELVRTTAKCNASIKQVSSDRKTQIKADQKKQLEDTINLSARLQSTLTEIDYYIDAMLFDAGSKKTTADLVNYLNEIQKAALAAQQDVKLMSKRGRPGGLTSTFDAFVFRLIKSAKSNGGNLTIYKAPSEDGWDGSLLQAIRELETVLPSKFLPQGKLLFSTLNRVADRAGRNPRK
jgi:hypothetical protein